MSRLLVTAVWCVLLLGVGACRRPDAPGDSPQPASGPAGPDASNLKRICAAVEEYKEENNGYFPPPSGKAYQSKRGIGLSWRVHLLPNLGESALYKQFNLDEPWDSGHNKPLIERMPAVYTTPGADLPAGQTYHKVFTGNMTAFPPGGLWMVRGFGNSQIPDISDGTSNTIMIVQGGTPVVWTKPEDIPYDPKQPLPDLRLGGKALILIGLCDGRVRTLDLDKLSEKTLRAVITRNGGEVLGVDWNEDTVSKPATP